MRIAVTGIHGQLARSLVERAAFHRVTVLPVGRPELDLAVPGSAAEAVGASRPDLVINAAAYTAVDRAEEEADLAFRINAEAAGEVADTAARLGVPIIHVSTDYVFDGALIGPYTENVAPRPCGVYGQSKLAGEELVRAANAQHVIVRTAWVYSPFGRNFVRTIMKSASTRDVLTVVDDQVGSPTSALDLADALLKAAGMLRTSCEGGLGETYHLAGTGTATWFQLAQHVMGECRALSIASAEVQPIKTADWPTKAVRPANSVLDSRKFARTFSFTMPQWQDSVSVVVKRLANQSDHGG